MDQEDVLLDIPVLNVDSIDLEVRDLRAGVSLQAEVLNLLRLNVGVDAILGEVKLGIRGVEAQALLKVRLDNVAAILNRVFEAIDHNPGIIEPLSKATAVALDQAGMGVGRALRDIGAGAGQAVQQAGQDIGQLSREAGRGAGEAVKQTGQGLAEAGRGAGQGLGQAGQGQGQQEQAGGRPSVEARSTVEADTWQSGQEGERSGGQQGQAGGQRRYRGLPRRTRRR